MGRTINFDREKTLKVITDLFLKNGYQGTSLSDLVSETGLNKPSLYNSFGNKDEMFLLALESYLENSKSKWKTEFQGLEFIQFFFDNLIEKSRQSEHGCLIMNSAIEFSHSDCDKAELSKKCWNKVLETLERALEHALSVGVLKEDITINELAKWFVSQAFAIRQLSKLDSGTEYTSVMAKEIKRTLKDIQK